ncbi:MAG TPA: DUF1367 family protein [Noviherbaspirillum sp.]|nr:DUF1367 family protein [Noviherbaspirillum sp.]
MTQALIVRDRSVEVSPAEREVATKVLEQAIRGVDEENHSRWRRFLRHVFGMEHGEIVEVGTRIPRSGPFHRFHMAIEQAVFDAQERFSDFEQFRNWIKIGAGHVDWVPGAKGGIVPLPKSISYARLEEQEMRTFHANMLAFLRGPHAAPYLWRHLGADKASEMMNTVLSGFDDSHQKQNRHQGQLAPASHQPTIRGSE